MGKVCRLRPIKILVASQDPRFESVVSFLLRRYGFDVVAARRQRGLDELVLRDGAQLAVVDVDVMPETGIELAALGVGVVAVAEQGSGPRSREPRVLPKWGPFQQLLAELDRLLAAGRAKWTPASVEPVDESAAVSAQPYGPSA